MNAPSPPAEGIHRPVTRRAMLGGITGAAALAAVPSLSFIAAGCSSSKSKPSQIEVMTMASTPTAGPPPADWFWYDAVKKATSLDIKLTIVTDASQYYVKLQTRAAANDLPDVFLTQPSTQSQLANQGLVADWTPFLDKMPNYVKAHDIQRFKPVGTFNGKFYGLTNRNWFPYKQVVIVRKDWLDNLGLQVPKTLDDYVAVMKAFTHDDPDGNGNKDTHGWTAAINPADGSLLGFDPFFGAYDALTNPATPWIETGTPPHATLSHVATTDNFKSALQFIEQLNAEGVIDPDWKSQTSDQLRTKFQSGKVGMLLYDWAGALSPADYIPFHQANPKGVLQIIDPPVGPSGAQAGSYYTAVGNMFGMSKRAADAGKGDAIAKWLDWLAGPGYLQTVAGQEGAGKGYTVGPNGPVVDYTNASYNKYRQMNTFALKGTTAEFIMRYFGTTTQGDGSVFNMADWLNNGLPNYPKKDVTSVAVAPPAPADIAADLTRTLSQGIFAFATGAKPLSDYAQFVATAKRAGLDKWTQAATQAVNKVGTI